MTKVKLLAKRPFSDNEAKVQRGDIIYRSQDVAKDYVLRKLCKYMIGEWEPTERTTKVDQPVSITEDVELKPINKPKRKTRATKSVDTK
jgi:hypothetical protein